PGHAAHAEAAADPGLRRVGARLLPQVSEPPSGLRDRVVERGELDRHRPALRPGGEEVKAAAAAESMPAVGSVAPDFTLPSTSGSEVTLSGLRGKNVLLAFFPLAFTRVCTAELCSFSDDYGAFG